MHGPAIIARSISAMTIPDKFGNSWQYHSRSDRHSKVSCWAIMFDLLIETPLLRTHIEQGKVGFGINHEMRDFQTGRKKNLDLVVCTPNTSVVTTGARSKANLREFSGLSDDYEVVLTKSERAALEVLPSLPLVPVGTVNVALEAKATMTAHVAALPRLHDELDSSHLTVHGHADHALAAALVLINIADEFASPGRNQRKLRKAVGPTLNPHNQPNDTKRTIAKILEIRRRVQPNLAGFDAIGIMVVDFRNDGSPCELVTKPPAPQPDDSHHYGQMVRRLSAGYVSKFSSL